VQARRIRPLRGAGGDSEEATLGIDCIQPSVRTRTHPGDVVAHGLDFPAGDRRPQHRQVGLAACRRECGRKVKHLSLGRSDLQDQHVLGHPALIPGQHTGDSQRIAFLAQQRVTAVTGTIGPDFPGLGEMADVLLLVARPGHVRNAPAISVHQRIADRVHRRHPVRAGCDRVERLGAHIGHDPHARHDVG